MINLAQNNGRIELEIEPETAEAAGLKISSRLLVVSHIASNATTEAGRDESLSHVSAAPQAGVDHDGGQQRRATGGLRVLPEL
jgi:hypothetical protein